MRDAELLPSRVRRSDALQRNRAEEAMIKRSASAGSVLHIAGSGNAEMSRAAAIDAQAASASNSFKSNSGSKTGSPLVGACRDAFGLDKLPAADAPKRRRRRQRKGVSDSEEYGSEEERGHTGAIPPTTTAQSSSAIANHLLDGVAARTAARSAQPSRASPAPSVTASSLAGASPVVGSCRAAFGLEGSPLLAKTGSPLIPPREHNTNKRAASLHNVLSIEKEQLRGLTLVSLLLGFGSLFARGGKAARDDPVGTFAHSRPVDSLDWFVSHSWRSPRAVKYLALLLCFNRRDAAVAASFAAIAACFVQTLYFDELPRWLTFVGPNTFTDFEPCEITKGCTLIGYAVLLCGLFGAHRVRQALGGKAVECFLDVACIQQADPAARARGISCLGALLDRSEKMVVLLDREYFTRLWCVFELAAFAKRAGMHRVQIVQLHSALIEWSIVLTMVLGNFAFVLLVPLMPDPGSKVSRIVLLMSLFLPMLLPQIRAMIWADQSADAIERLRYFRLDDAVCEGAEDRMAIVTLIASWYTDKAVALPPEDLVCLGRHRFEQFVRFDVRLAVEAQHVRARFSHTTVAMTILTLSAGLLDTLASPETTLITCFDMLTNLALMASIALPLWAIGLQLAARVVAALERRGSMGIIRYTIGVSIVLVITAVNLSVVTALTLPVQTLLQGSGWHQAGDGLEAAQRQQLKLQALCLAAVWAGLRV